MHLLSYVVEWKYLLMGSLPNSCSYSDKVGLDGGAEQGTCSQDVCLLPTSIVLPLMMIGDYLLPLMFINSLFKVSPVYWSALL